jgi:hypothetical protein
MIVLWNRTCAISLPTCTARKPEALAEGFSSISTVGGNKIMRKDDVGVLVHDDTICGEKKMIFQFYSNRGFNEHCENIVQ